MASTKCFETNHPELNKEILNTRWRWTLGNEPKGMLSTFPVKVQSLFLILLFTVFFAFNWHLWLTLSESIVHFASSRNMQNLLC